MSNRMRPDRPNPMSSNQIGPDVVAITTGAIRGLVSVTADGVLIASSQCTQAMYEELFPPIVYIPREDVDESVLAPSSKRTYHPAKGTCEYFDVQVNGRWITNAAWCYPSPPRELAQIAGHLAFYPFKVEVRVGAPQERPVMRPAEQAPSRRPTYALITGPTGALVPIPVTYN